MHFIWTINVFNTNVMEDTIRRRDCHFTWSSELHEGQVVSGQRQYIYFSPSSRNWVLVGPRETNPRPPALQSSALPTQLQSCDSWRSKENGHLSNFIFKFYFFRDEDFSQSRSMMFFWLPPISVLSFSSFTSTPEFSLRVSHKSWKRLSIPRLPLVG